MKKFLTKFKILRISLGWSYLSWNHALLGLERKLNLQINKNSSVLEIGAAYKSISSLRYYGLVDNIDITFYPENSFLENSIRNILKKFLKNKIKSNSNVNIFTLNFFELPYTDKRYDLIILKSVLGGLNRDLNSSKERKEKISELLNKVIKNNLKKNGYLITLDNCKSIYSYIPLLKNHMTKSWLYLDELESIKSSGICFFGFFSGIDLTTKFGIIGEICESFLFILDLFLFKNIFKKFFPKTIIARVFKKNDFP